MAARTRLLSSKWFTAIEAGDLQKAKELIAAGTDA
jgi:hypothetical protein